MTDFVGVRNPAAWRSLARAILAIGCITGASCLGGKGSEPELAGPAASRPPEVRFMNDPELVGMKLTLREVDPAAGDADRLPLPPTTALDAPTTARLLERVPALEGADGDRTPFALRPASLPPPRPGTPVDVAFPPTPGAPPPAVAAKTVSVLRFAPEGDVPMAPNLSVTFDQPMVAVTSQDEAAKTVPVKLDPTPPGRWRWLGTKTLMFDPAPPVDDGTKGGRFPMATTYTVEIPAGTKSAAGAPLVEPSRFTFQTPTAQLGTVWPQSEPSGLEPLIVLPFDQAVDGEALLAHLTLTGGSASYPLRLATDAEIAADPVAKAAVDATVRKRIVIVRPTKALPKATTFSITLKAGAPSAEGPRKTPSDQGSSFATYAPLEIVEHDCDWRGECPPTSGWFVRFNNPIDPEKFEAGAFKVDPAVPGLHLEAYGDVVHVAGAFQGRTKYTLTVPAGLVDSFGQTLGKDKALTYSVGPAERTLIGPGQELVTLDPRGPAALSVFSTNHNALRVRVNAVTPDDWDDWVKWQRTFNWEDNTPGPLPGTRVRDEKVAVNGEPDRQAETRVTLPPAAHGQYLVAIEPTVQPPDRWNRQYVFVWVQRTEIGLTAFADATHLVGWANRLADGAPLANVAVSLWPKGRAGVTAANGLAELPLDADPTAQQVLVARSGDDVAILPRYAGYWNDSGWARTDIEDQLRWYVADDRGLYKPGEKAWVKGWLRRFEPRVGGDLRGLTKPATVSWTLRDSVGNEIKTGKTPTSALGGFAIQLDLPKDMNLGPASLELQAADVQAGNVWFTHPLQVQEFRRPEYEVTSTASAAPHTLGTEAIVDVQASYFAGGALPNADVTWEAWADPASFVPPNQDDYAFGVWSPWWWWGAPDASRSGYVSLVGKTGAGGAHHVGVHFDAVNPARPMTVTTQATVYDVNRQGWTTTQTMLVHPADRYVGLRAKRGYVGKGEPIDVDVLVVDLDGKPAAAKTLEVKGARLQTSWKGGKYTEERVDEKVCDATPGAAPHACAFRWDIGGVYQIVATLTDAEGRINRTETRVWMSGGDAVPSRSVEEERVVLVPEKREVLPGESAKFLVQAPFAPAEGTLTIRRSGLVRSERFTMTEASRSFEIPIDDSFVPNVEVRVDLVGEAPRVDDQGKPRPDLAKRVAYASGTLMFEVPPKKRTLAVTVKPKLAKLLPGGATEIDVDVRDAAGAPVRDAEMVVVVVDEAVLSLTGYQLPDPIGLFYAARGGDVDQSHQRAQVVLADPGVVAVNGLGTLGTTGMGSGGGGYGAATEEGSARPMPTAPMAAAMADAPMEPAAEKAVARRENKSKADKDSEDRSGAGSAIAMRTNFEALALFAPEVRTDAAGHATVPVQFPDSLTRYRVWVVAVAGDRQFGKGEADVTARLPLMVRPSAPRFLNFGDQFELPIVLQNQTDAAMTVDVAVRGTNVVFTDKITAVMPDLPDTAVSSAGRRVTVPANDRVEVRFPAATQMAGTARFQAVATAGDTSDAANFELPVWTPATTEAFATYGDVATSDPVLQPILPPPGVWSQFGGLEVTTSSTQLQALTDAVLYLIRYPFECNEQLGSRLMAVAGLRDVLDAFQADGLPPRAEIDATVVADLDKLTRRQNWDGGWSFFRKGDPSWPYPSIFVAHSLAAAKAKGYAPDPDTIARSLDYLRTIERHIPSWYSRESKWILRAYAIEVRLQLGDADVGEARRLLKEAGASLPIDAQAWILPTLHQAKAPEVATILRNLNNAATETAGAAAFSSSYSDGAYVLLHTDRRTDAIVLDALLRVKPDADLIPKVVRGLLAHKTRGRWTNTQENAFVLLGLDRYFHVYEKETPDFVARVWLGDGYVGDHSFKGRTTDLATSTIPMGFLQDPGGERPLVLKRDGPAGRLYYRIGMRYAPKDLRLAPRDDGFAVERTYEGARDPGDVRRDPDGTWHIKAGAEVRVRLTMAVEARRYHVALVDPIPAGLEVVNPDLATSGAMPEDPGAASSGDKYWWWWRTWYEHENLRDDRVEVFSSLVWDGVHTYSYVTRATTPGRFVVPPPKAEEMYMPETFGRGATDFVVIE